MGSSLQTTIRDLRLRRGRERRGLALAEGVRLVEEALAAGIPLRGAAVSPRLETTTRGQALAAALTAAGIRLQSVSDAELSALADTEHPQGVVAVIEPRRWRLEDISGRNIAPILVLDGVQDPGNVGTMVRTALAFGAAGVVALKGTAELTNSKLIRSSMGALFRLPAVATETGEFLRWTRDRGIPVWTADVAGEPITRTPALPMARSPAIVVGNEGAGVSDELAAIADRRVSIPLAPGAESLNVAVAAGILLYEVIRAG